MNILIKIVWEINFFNITSGDTFMKYSWKGFNKLRHLDKKLKKKIRASIRKLSRTKSDVFPWAETTHRYWNTKATVTINILYIHIPPVTLEVSQECFKVDVPECTMKAQTTHL